MSRQFDLPDFSKPPPNHPERNAAMQLHVRTMTDQRFTMYPGSSWVPWPLNQPYGPPPPYQQGGPVPQQSSQPSHFAHQALPMPYHHGDQQLVRHHLSPDPRSLVAPQAPYGQPQQSTQPSPFAPQALPMPYLYADQQLVRHHLSPDPRSLLAPQAPYGQPQQSTQPSHFAHQALPMPYHRGDQQLVRHHLSPDPHSLVAPQAPYEQPQQSTQPSHLAPQALPMPDHCGDQQLDRQHLSPDPHSLVAPQAPYGQPQQSTQPSQPLSQPPLPRQLNLRSRVVKISKDYDGSAAPGSKQVESRTPQIVAKRAKRSTAASQMGDKDHDGSSSEDDDVRAGPSGSSSRKQTRPNRATFPSENDYDGSAAAGSKQVESRTPQIVAKRAKRSTAASQMGDKDHDGSSSEDDDVKAGPSGSSRRKQTKPNGANFPTENDESSDDFMNPPGRFSQPSSSKSDQALQKQSRSRLSLGSKPPKKLPNKKKSAAEVQLEKLFAGHTSKKSGRSVDDPSPMSKSNQEEEEEDSDDDNISGPQQTSSTLSNPAIHFSAAAEADVVIIDDSSSSEGSYPNTREKNADRDNKTNQNANGADADSDEDLWDPYRPTMTPEEDESDYDCVICHSHFKAGDFKGIMKPCNCSAYCFPCAVGQRWNFLTCALCRKIVVDVESQPC